MPGGKGNIRPSDNPKPFQKGNKAAVGHGRPPSLSKLIDKLWGDGEDIEDMLKAGMRRAKRGDIQWGRELLERIYGKVKHDINIGGSINIHFDKEDADL